MYRGVCSTDKVHAVANAKRAYEVNYFNFVHVNIHGCYMKQTYHVLTVWVCVWVCPVCTYHMDKLTDLCTCHMDKLTDLCTCHMDKLTDLCTYHMDKLTDLCTYHMDKLTDLCTYHMDKLTDLCTYHMDKLTDLRNGFHFLQDHQWTV